MTEDEVSFQQLQWSVQALAAKLHDQTSLYPTFVCVACELVTDFDNWYRATVWRDSLTFTSQQLDALRAVDDAISSVNDTPCFDTSQLNNPDWQRLREIAAACCKAFEWPLTLPPQGRSAYVQGG